jgi:hypothetical protein
MIYWLQRLMCLDVPKQQQVIPDNSPAAMTRVEDRSPTVHGPFHRVKSPTQTDSTAELQEQSSEMCWGKARRGSGIPQV